MLLRPPPRPRPGRVPRRRPWLAAGTLALGLALAACGTGASPSPPTGVDGLVVPTPRPDPRDFVARVTNPLLAAAPGTRWRFDDGRQVVASAGPRHDGIATTSLTTTLATTGAGDSGATTSAVHLAQDVDGNVWLLGRTDAASQAPAWADSPGLYLPAAPRRGDGYLREPGTRVEVLSTAAEEVTPAGRFEDAVLLGIDGLDTEAYVRGVGPVSLGAAVLSERVPATS